MVKKDDETPPDRSGDHPDQQIIDYLEACLNAAREGRVAFVVASVGIVFPSNQPRAGDQRNPDRFSVAVGGFLGQTSFLLHPASRESAVDDVCRGAALCATKLREVATPAPPQGKSS